MRIHFFTAPFFILPLLRLWHKSFNIYTDIVCAKAEPDIDSASQGFCKEMQE